ncbi:peptide chain release factor 2 [Leptospira vanthielii]|uniref:Peptide chain release factor 2 n=1 Tax=Leptospira vanthielii serovar Holland str. Waz Holland = ATCC 700522 TaxID=1218591 RepID=N1WHW8_9LEPT|nr:peptide chain release factor 2 [Leptospira vanthielii]EMY71456.1 peptide chain release factor 2 [Leptospira vanthielii serovar Holland str. Waz Holland = ATCC 700522]
MDRSLKDLKKQTSEMIESFQTYWAAQNFQEDYDRLSSLIEKANDPKLWDSPDHAKTVTQKRNELQLKLDPWLELKKELIDFPDLIELTSEEMGEAGLKSLNDDFDRMFEAFENLQMLDALAGKDDGKAAFINIHPGAGGTESQDWADMLLRMYTRFCEQKGYRAELVDYQPGETAGIKNATLYIQGDHPFGYLKCESGVHRLVRISPFDSNKRRHTSFASVYVTPEVDDDIQVNIEEKDLRVDVYRSSGAGGQHVNTTDSAVRITHIPSGVVVSCQMERSQIKNRDTAMKMLRARLYEMEKQKAEEENAKKAGEKRDISWGSQIRSYVFHPYNLVKDHRTDFETGNVHAVMDGDLEDFVIAYLKYLTNQKANTKV